MRPFTGRAAKAPAVGTEGQVARAGYSGIVLSWFAPGSFAPFSAAGHGHGFPRIGGCPELELQSRRARLGLAPGRCAAEVGEHFGAELTPP